MDSKVEKVLKGYAEKHSTPKEGDEFTTNELAVLVNRKRRSLYKWVELGKRNPRKDSGGQYIWTYEDYIWARGIKAGNPHRKGVDQDENE